MNIRSPIPYRECALWHDIFVFENFVHKKSKKLVLENVFERRIFSDRVESRQITHKGNISNNYCSNVLKQFAKH